jgi:hypothetical protein
LHASPNQPFLSRLLLELSIDILMALLLLLEMLSGHLLLVQVPFIVWYIDLLLLPCC